MSQTDNIATANPGRCAAVNPSATHAFRLIMPTSSITVEDGSKGAIVRYGTQVPAEEAEECHRGTGRFSHVLESTRRVDTLPPGT